MTAHDDDLTAVPISSRRGPTYEDVAHELVAMRSIIEHMPPLEHLEVSRHPNLAAQYQPPLLGMPDEGGCRAGIFPDLMVQCCMIELYKRCESCIEGHCMCAGEQCGAD